jgi:hypothetical protein
VASRKAPTSSRSWELPNITWETSIYYKKFTLVNEQCREYCLSDCFCVAALFIGNSDCAEVAVLANGRRANDVTMKAFIKVRTGSAQSTRTRTVLRPNKIITICLPLIVVITIGGLLAQHYYLGRNRESKQLLSTSVRAFSWQELYQATKGFEKTAAYWVKGASGRSTKVHHRNLVRMIGYCKEGKHRMLVFEFMPGGSLRSLCATRCLRRCCATGRRRSPWRRSSTARSGSATASSTSGSSPTWPRAPPSTTSSNAAAAFDAVQSGCTALSIVKQGGLMVVANVGDSRAVLGTTSDDGAVAAV